MKKGSFLFTLLIATAIFTACGDGGKAAAEAAAIKNAAVLDSIANEVNKSTEAVNAQTVELDSAVNDLVKDLGLDAEKK